MERRELLKMIAVLTGGSLIGGEVFLSGCKTAMKTEPGFTPANIALLDEVGETIIPATSTPGAKDAKIGEFMKVYVTDCYTQEEQDIFSKGLGQLNELSDKMTGKSFMDATPEERRSILTSLEKESKAYNDKNAEADKIKRDTQKTVVNEKNKTPVSTPLHYYSMMKQLTLFGYFTSKPGATQARRNLPVPGKFIGDYPYKKGDRAWS